jgi:Domain of unknown function (DUF6602)
VPMLDIYFQALREVMGAEARLLGKVFRTHRGKLGENREALLQRFFSTYLPQRFGVGTGFALLGEDISTQQDVVVYDRLNNPVLFPESAAPLFPPSALAAVVEVKSTLTRTELKKTVAKSVAMKRGIRASLANHPAPPHVQALSCLFAFRVRSLPLPTLLDALAEEEEALGAPPLDRLDMVCILGKGLVLGSSVFHTVTTDGEVLSANAQATPQHWLALESEHELLMFYSLLLDHIMGRGEVRPQLMSYLPPDMGMGRVLTAR